MKARSAYKHKSPLAKLPRLLWRLVRVGFKIETEFRTDFWMSLLNFVTWNALYITFWQAIVGKAGALGTWTVGELLVLNFALNVQGALSIPFLGFRRLPEKVREGALDKYLCRPVNPILVTCFESVHVVAFVRHLAIALAGVGACVWIFQLRVTAWRALLAALLSLFTTLIWACLRGTVSLLSFWMGKVGTIGFFLGVGRRFERYPIDVFPRAVRVTLTWFVPAAFTGTYPAMVLLGKPLDLGRLFAIALILLGIWGGVLAFVSRKALQRYEAFGG
jgi:ABC-2 type transport system permease protein